MAVDPVSNVVLARVRASGLALRYGNQAFWLDSVGALTAAQVRDRDDRGQLVWSDDAAHAWFLESTGPRRQETSSPTAATQYALPVEGVSANRPTVDTTNVVGRRYVAFLLDSVIVWTAEFIIGLMLSSASSDGSDVQSAARVIGLILFTSYFAFAEAYYGKTIGKAIIGLRVVTDDGRQISIGQAFGRNFALMVDLLLWTAPALISMSTSPLHQRLGDKAAHTAVVIDKPWGRGAQS